jgi:hypothetical protein
MLLPRPGEVADELVPGYSGESSCSPLGWPNANGRCNLSYILACIQDLDVFGVGVQGPFLVREDDCDNCRTLRCLPVMSKMVSCHEFRCHVEQCVAAFADPSMKDICVDASSLLLSGASGEKSLASHRGVDSMGKHAGDCCFDGRLQ